MRTNILKTLREHSGFVSGQQLCEQFQVSRTAVWKAIRKLEEEGYKIEAVRNKGYRLVESPDILSREEIQSRIQTQRMAKNLIYFDETDSTNMQAKNLADQGAPDGTLVVADMQRSGRGRRGRHWESPPGSSVYMSLLLRPEFAPSQASMLTLVMAMAVAKAVEQLTGLKAGIKWPNDIVIDGKKVCGILTEMSAEVDYIHHVVIGVGMNVNMTDFPKELKETATSLRLQTHEKIVRSSLISATMETFEILYTTFLQTEDMTGLMEEYNQSLLNRNQNVKVLGAQEEFQGFALGINETGELMVQKEDNTVVNVYAGEVSVRGVYGYV